jgi:hypothetical protein
MDVMAKTHEVVSKVKIMDKEVGQNMRECTSHLVIHKSQKQRATRKVRKNKSRNERLKSDFEIGMNLANKNKIKYGTCLLKKDLNEISIGDTFCYII